MLNGKPLDQAGTGDEYCNEIGWGINVNVLDTLSCLLQLNTGQWDTQVCADLNWWKYEQFWHDLNDCYEGCVRCLAQSIEKENVTQVTCGDSAGFRRFGSSGIRLKICQGIVGGVILAEEENCECIGGYLI